MMASQQNELEAELNAIVIEHNRLRIHRKKDDLGIKRPFLLGNLVIPHSNGSYLLPVVIDFPPLYPSDPPKISLNMNSLSPLDLDSRCPYLCKDGVVRHPYLDNWCTKMMSFRSSTLSRLLIHLIKSFSECPPIYTPRKILEDTVRIPNHTPPIPPRVLKHASAGRCGISDYPHNSSNPPYQQAFDSAGPKQYAGNPSVEVPFNAAPLHHVPPMVPVNYGNQYIPSKISANNGGHQFLGPDNHCHPNRYVPPKIPNSSPEFPLSFISSNDSSLTKVEKIINGCGSVISLDMSYIVDKSDEVRRSAVSINEALLNMRSTRDYLMRVRHNLETLCDSLEKYPQTLSNKSKIDPDVAVKCKIPEHNKLIELLAGDITCSDLFFHLNKGLDLHLISLECYISAVRKVAYNQFVIRELYRIMDMRIRNQ